MGAHTAGDPLGVRAAAEEGRDLADAIGDRFNSRVCRFSLGSAQTFSGDLAGAVTQFGEVAAEAHAAHDEIWSVISLGARALHSHARVRRPRRERRLRRHLRAPRSLAEGSRHSGTRSRDTPPWPPGTLRPRSRRARPPTST